MSGQAPRVPAHVATTRHLCAAYPLVSEAGLGHEGVLIGRDVLGGSFVYDPFVLYRLGVVTNPNAVVFGQIGRGKSSFVKSYLWRQAVFGRHAWVVDPKGEYGPLAQAWNVSPVALRPGGAVRLNPLDTQEDPDGPGPAGLPGEGTHRQRVVLTSSLAVACLGRDLRPRERAAIDAALAEATAQAHRARMPAPTLPQVVDALLEPGLDASLALRTSRAELLEDGRDVALELRRLVHGDLCGMFDGPNSTISPMAPEERPYVVYTRLSEVRAGDKAPSLADQARLCVQFLESHGLPVGPVLEERGRSASKPAKERPVFKAMMQRIEAGEFGGLIVWKMDRLTRQMVQQGPILAALKESGARLVSVTETLDTSTAMGQAIVGFIVAQAETESENTSIRVAKAEERRVDAGLPHGGGQRSMGYGKPHDGSPESRAEASKVRNVRNEEEAKVVREIAARLTSGESLRAVATWLNNSGITTTSGRQWTHSTVKQMISSPKLRGERVHHGKVSKLQDWTPILSAEEQFAVLDAIHLANGFKASPERTKNKYLLSGLIRCSWCDRGMYPHRGTRNEMRYLCRAEPPVHRCARSIVIEATDRYAVSCAVDYAEQHPEVLEPPGNDAADLVRIETEIEAAMKTLNEIQAEKFRVHPDERVTFDLAIAETTERLAQLRPRQANLAARIDRTPGFTRWGSEPWQSKEVAVRRQWLRVFISKIWIDAGRKGGGFDTSRIRIEWLHGPYEPEPDMSYEDAVNANLAEDWLGAE